MGPAADSGFPVPPGGRRGPWAASVGLRNLVSVHDGKKGLRIINCSPPGTGGSVSREGVFL